MTTVAVLARPSTRLASHRAARRDRRQDGVGEPLRLRRLPRAERGPPVGAGNRPLLLPPEAREPPRGAALERRLPLLPGAARHPAGNDQGDGPHRDDPCRVRDGGDPVRAPRPLGGAERGPLGLHLLGDQEVPRPRRLRASGPGAGHDDRPVHARVHGAPRPFVPHARSARDRRDGGVHPQPAGRRGQRDRAHARARGQAARVRGRLRRDVGRASGPRPRRDGGVRRSARRAAEPARAEARGRVHAGRRSPERVRDARRGHRGRRARECLGRDPLHRILALGRRCGRHRQPDGGRGHRRDLALADLAVGTARAGRARGRRADRGGGRGRAAFRASRSRKRVRFSSRSRSPTTSSSS